MLGSFGDLAVLRTQQYRKEVRVTAVPPFKESSRELIVEVAQALKPYFPDITHSWREKLTQAAGFEYFCHHDFPGFEENLQYFGTRLSKLQVNTRAVARCLELYLLSCDPYLSGLFPEREAEAKATLEMLSSVSFVIISGAYFDAKTLESNALLSLLDAELAADDLGVLLQKVLEITTRTFEACMGAVLLLEPEQNHLKIASNVGLEDAVPEDFTLDVG